VRHSADLDFFPVSGEMPNVEKLSEILLDGLTPLSKLLDLHPLNLKTISSGEGQIKLMLSNNDGKVLFTVDITGTGPVLESGVEEIPMEAIGVNLGANIKYVSRNQLLLNTDAHVYRSWYLAAIGNLPDAINESRSAEGLDPLSVNVNTGLDTLYFMQREYDKFLKQCQKALEINPTVAIIHYDLFDIYAAKSMYDKAIDEMAQGYGLKIGHNKPPRSIRATNRKATKGRCAR
jgi:tetratricopeptide (TPR) repeat protein